jgi:hypothetical protein
MLFLGDSITRQTYYAFLAELTRLDGDNISIQRYRQPFQVPPGICPNTFKRMHEFDKFEDKNGGLSTVYLDPEKTEMTTVWYENLAGNDHVSKVERTISLLQEAGCNGTVVLANIGLHLNNQSIAKDEYRRMLSFLERLGANERNLIMWREGTAQHFSTDDGTFDPSRREEYTTCQKIEHPKEGDSGIGWRNQVALEVWRELKIKHIVYVPFYKATEPLYDTHKEVPPGALLDCTHYCHFPMLWQPLWKGLAKGVLKM